MSGRLKREQKTIRTMIRMYCSGLHKGDSLCSGCEDLETYAMQRIDKCPFEDCKPTCVKCHVHCYKPTMREQIRQVMRYAGPRMLFSHPWLTLWHYIDEWTGSHTVTGDETT